MNDARRVAVFSDVHGNLPALRAVWDAIEARGPFDEVIAAGDHCLSGPQPAESLDMVAQISTVVLYGNTDRDIVTAGSSDPELGAKKSDTIDWVRERLGDERLKRLADLRFDARVAAPDGSLLQVVHANPHDVDRHIFPDMTNAALRELIGVSDATVLAFGHLHIPFTRQIDGLTLANIASVGLPRDGDRRATWGEFTWDEPDGWSVVTHRVEYDYQETVRLIFSCGIPHPEKRAEDLLKATYD